MISLHKLKQNSFKEYYILKRVEVVVFSNMTWQLVKFVISELLKNENNPEGELECYFLNVGLDVSHY
jgi:hypothetical protein